MVRQEGSDVIGTRAFGEDLMRRFVPDMGKRYAQYRNFDLGPGEHRHVSRLSPYIRRRLVLEQEVVAAAIAAHGPGSAEKFVQEVIWRSYFKGWLERRPQVWTMYCRGLEVDLARLDTAPDLAARVSRAEAGETGLACFDAWSRELVETGYLHNHARMWFASIWVFTLELPWRIGADFFLRHLLDGDPASNTLGWRWVVGLHTRGKTYKAAAWNIARYTRNRFEPGVAELAELADGLEGEEPDGLPPVQPLRLVTTPAPGLPTGLLLTEEECRVEDFDLSGLDIPAAATLSASHLRSPRGVSDEVAAFEAAALRDSAARMGRSTDALRAGAPDELARWAVEAGIQQIATPYVPEGPLRQWILRAETDLNAAGVRLSEWRRPWDSLIWPHASAGFFKVKKKIPEILDEIGIG